MTSTVPCACGIDTHAHVVPHDFPRYLGSQLPAKVHLVVVLTVSFCLGILVTYAEPAISAIRPLASLVRAGAW